jgi:DNA-binding beta-propeller fold protein YncE
MSMLRHLKNPKSQIPNPKKDMGFGIWGLGFGVWGFGILFLLPLVALADDAGTTFELVQTIQLKGKAGKLDHLALDAKRERLFLANTSNGTLDVVDLKDGKLHKQVTGQTGIQGVAYAADLDKVFVGLGSGGLCNVFDGEAYKPLKTIKFTDDADNVRYDPASHLVFVAHAEKALGVIDAKSYAVKTDLNLPGAAEGFQIAPGKPRLFMVLPMPSQVSVIDVEKLEIIENYPLKLAGNGHPLALDEANKRVFIGCRTEPKVVVMDSETGKEIVAIDIPQEVDDLYYDAKRKRLYATCGEGFIAVIKQKDANTYEVVEKAPTAKGAKTAMYDAAAGKLYVAVPRQVGKAGPEIRVYRVKD